MDGRVEGVGLISFCKFCKSSGKKKGGGTRNLCHMQCTIPNVSIPAAFISAVYYIGMGKATQHPTVLWLLWLLLFLKACMSKVLCVCVCV